MKLVRIAIIFGFLLLAAAPFLYRASYSQTETPPARPPGVSESLPEPRTSADNEPRLDCAGCHGAGKTLPYLAGEKFHKNAHSDYAIGFHSKAANNGKKAANCADCHTVGGDLTTMLPADDPKSTINRANIAQTCGQCHNDPSLMKASGTTNRPFLAFQESVHGKALARGDLKAAVCTDCHKSHDVLPATDSQSSISKFNVAATCAKCHGQISTEFTESVHGAALTRGNYQSPNCTDCHGIHSIRAPKMSRENLGLASCASCHDGVRLTQDYGIEAGKVTSYEDSYHGRAKKLGSDVVADCASCHGVHNILPSNNPKSLIHSSNLVQTCGQCHLGATEKFSVGKVHLNTPASQDIGSLGINWVRTVYLALIFGIVGGMIAHNGLIWYRKVAARRKLQKATIVRMSVNQRIQHWLLLISFITLVVSGFALEYGDTWLGWMFFNSEEARRLIHRVAAVVMLVVGVYHVFYLVFYREGRRWFIDMLPRWKDFVDLYQNLRYYLLMKGEKPKFARFRYADKAEYWAVIWGTILMGVTGLMIWFKIDVFGFLPRWVIDVAIAVHFYEAVLATLAIVIWHFYHVIFDPDVYPINTAFYDGMMSEEMFKEEHELAYEQMKEAELRATGENAPDALAGEEFREYKSPIGEEQVEEIQPAEEKQAAEEPAPAAVEEKSAVETETTAAVDEAPVEDEPQTPPPAENADPAPPAKKEE